MSVKKYRLYLLMLTLVVVIVGALSYLYFVEQDKTYKDGTLVKNEYLLEDYMLAQNNYLSGEEVA